MSVSLCSLHVVDESRMAVDAFIKFAKTELRVESEL